MEKRMQKVIISLFLAFLTGFGILHLALPDRDFSPVENRELQTFPSFSWEAFREGTFTEKLEKYLSDQFPLRDGWMGLKTRCEFLLGQREFHGVYVCGDTLIQKVEDGGQGNKNLQYVQALTEKTGVPVYLALIPTAGEIWRSKLPQGAESFDQKTFLEQAEISVPGAKWVDVYGALINHEDEPVFYRTDHHWTSLGAYYGFQAVMEAMGFDQAPLEDGLTVSEDFLGTLYSLSGVHWLEPDTIERYVLGDGVEVEDVEKGTVHGLYVDSFLEEKDKYASFLGGNSPLLVVRNPGVQGEKLLIVRDSYCDSLTPFLCQQFSEIHLLDPRYARLSAAQSAQKHNIDRILICYGLGNFLSDGNMVFIGK